MWSQHTFPVSGAQMSARATLDLHVIMLLGRWGSACSLRPRGGNRRPFSCSYGRVAPDFSLCQSSHTAQAGIWTECSIPSSEWRSSCCRWKYGRASCQPNPSLLPGPVSQEFTQTLVDSSRLVGSRRQGSCSTCSPIGRRWSSSWVAEGGHRTGRFDVRRALGRPRHRLGLAGPDLPLPFARGAGQSECDPYSGRGLAVTPKSLPICRSPTGQTSSPTTSPR